MDLCGGWIWKFFDLFIKILVRKSREKKSSKLCLQKSSTKIGTKHRKTGEKEKHEKHRNLYSL